MTLPTDAPRHAAPRPAGHTAPRRLHWGSMLHAPVLLAAYLALVLNAPKFWQRADQLTRAQESPAHAAWTVAAEAALVLAICVLVMGLLAALGRVVLLALGSAVLLLSAAASYYMVRFDVVIGYGIVQAVTSSDQAMAHEKLSLELLAWVLLLGVLPLVLWARLVWRDRQRPRPPRRRAWLAGIALGLAALGLAWASEAAVKHLAKRSAVAQHNVSPSGLVAHRYVPTNWLSGLGMTAANRATAAWRERQLRNPATHYTYRTSVPLDDVTVVMVIGESTRHDHLGLLGYARETTPRLRAEPGLVAFRAQSCDTTTRLSLACMFVRPEGVTEGQGFEPDQIHERKVFSVLRKLGFTIDLFAMQSEAGFYHRVGPDFYKMREVIVADANGGTEQAVDGLLLPEVEGSLRRHPRGKHLVILHQKGSHFLYSQRYPRDFARWTPECHGSGDQCSRDQLINAYDNSVLYTDHVMAELFKRLSNRKALVVFSSDHGESIDEGTHFHGTPRAIAPPEQRRVPMLFWASAPLLAEPAHRQAFERLRARAATGNEVRHQNLFASLLGCLSVTSDDGGITPADNLCQ